MQKKTKTPLEMRLTMPAEWEPQESILLAWPWNTEDWPGKFEPVPWVYAEMIRAIAHTQKVRLIVRDSKMQSAARKILSRAGANLKHVLFHQIPTDRVWMRDSGPIIVKSGKERIALNWRFNAWAKYPNHKLDDQIPIHMAPYLNMGLIEPMHKGKHVVLEGGGIDVNGAGALITTEEWLLSKKQIRNPGFTRADYEALFEKYLGIDQVIWLGNGIVGDDTHGHVDDITRFVNTRTIVTAIESNKKDANYGLLQDNLKRLRKARDTKGKAYDVVELPMPKPVIFEGERLPASYANFLICNDVVLVPVFNDPNDRIALNILAEYFKTRSIVPIYCGDFVWGLGTIHCASQQIPA
jgi:agmatine deiminase